MRYHQGNKLHECQMYMCVLFSSKNAAACLNCGLGLMAITNDKKNLKSSSLVVAYIATALKL